MTLFVMVDFECDIEEKLVEYFDYFVIKVIGLCGDKE